MSRETWHAVLTVAGAACEIVGLTWIVADAARARRSEFNEYGPLRRVWNWFKYWLGAPEQVIAKSGAVHLSARGGATAKGIRAGETELERVQRELTELRDYVEQYEVQVAERFGALDARVSLLGDDLTTRIEDVKKRSEERRRADLLGEIRGARLFILGAILSAIANFV
jgi:hypothetical protein